MELQLKVTARDEHIYPAGHVTAIGAPISPQVDATKPKSLGIGAETEREVMYGLVVEMLREAHRLAGDEVLAKKAEARMTAMLVASNLARTGEAILRGYERGYLQPLVDELVNLIEQLKEQLEQARQAGQESAPTSATT
jgi:hypothetical protein